MLFQAQTLREIIEMAEKVEDRNYVLQQVQGFIFESGKGIETDKPVGFRPNYHRVADIL